MGQPTGGEDLPGSSHHHQISSNKGWRGRKPQRLLVNVSAFAPANLSLQLHQPFQADWHQGLFQRSSRPLAADWGISLNIRQGSCWGLSLPVDKHIRLLNPQSCQAFKSPLIIADTHHTRTAQPTPVLKGKSFPVFGELPKTTCRRIRVWMPECLAL